MSRGVFITGTDTGVGKTQFTISLMEALKNQGRKVSGMKPVASGAVLTNGALMNEDAALIMQHCSVKTDYELINPVIFKLAVAPHIAAQQENKKIDLDQIVCCYKRLVSDCENIVVEGVGGWRVPLSTNIGLVDLVRILEIPVVLVVGIKLGCINHALLTAESIRSDGIKLKGWVSNRIDKDYLLGEETIETLKSTLSCTYIADLPYTCNFNPTHMAERIDLSFLSES